jgi:type II secretory pathway pseudopilin PulG
MSKNSTGKVTRRSPVVVLIALLLAAFSSLLMAQANRGTELDKAYEEARAAYLALQEAAARRWNDLK